MTALPVRTPAWTPVCRLEQVPLERGVAALVDGEQVALFRTRAGDLHAVANRDPRSGAMVVARGLVGSRQDRAVVFAPLYKQAFDLQTGRCLDDAGQALPVHGVRVRDGLVEVRLAPPPVAG